MVWPYFVIGSPAAIGRTANLCPSPTRAATVMMPPSNRISMPAGNVRAATATLSSGPEVDADVGERDRRHDDLRGVGADVHDTGRRPGGAKPGRGSTDCAGYAAAT